jgi:uncharacterized protein (TIGR03790 family)
MSSTHLSPGREKAALRCRVNPGSLRLALLLLLTAGTCGRANTNAPAASADDTGPITPKVTWPSPLLATTNAVSSSFLDTHPLAGPSSSPAPDSSSADPSLSLHSDTPPATPAEPSPPGIDKSPADRNFIFPEGDPDQLPEHLLVVYNSSDPESKALAQYYAGKRAIPAERVLGIACSTGEEITREQYENTIREPIISYIYKQGWMSRRSITVTINNHPMDLLVADHNDVWAMVLMRGVPLKIANDPSLTGSMEAMPQLQTNAAAVDSELALLPVFGLPAGGFVRNIFFDGVGSGLVRAGPELAAKLILVTRLDGPRASDVRRMIDDTLFAEQNRLAGLAVIDSRGLTDAKDPYVHGDNWLRRARDLLSGDGWMVKFDDDPAVLPSTDPCNHVALYLGWYHDGACGPWVTPPNRFERGAIAYHLHSFSGITVRSTTDAWVGPLIAHGAAATMGTVYEPFLDLTPHIDIFTQRLLAGDYFAEAAYASEPGLSWMVTVVGDPLYRPFRKSLDTAMESAGTGPSDQHDWLLLQQVQRALAAGRISDDTATLERYLDVPGPVAQEGLGDLLGKLNNPEAEDAALSAYEKAEMLEVQPVDAIRVGLKLAQLDEAGSHRDRADVELRTLWERYPSQASRFGVPNPLAFTENPSTPLVPVSARPSTPASRPPQPPSPPRPSSP